MLRSLALTSFKALLRLVDHVDAAFTANDLAIAVTRLQRAERVCDFHGRSLLYRGASGAIVDPCFPKEAVNGGRYWDRTSGHYDVNVVLYR